MLVGQILESQMDFLWLSKGTRGIVLKATQLGDGTLRLVVDWHLYNSGRGRIVRDSLSISAREFQQFFRLVTPPPRPKAD